MTDAIKPEIEELELLQECALIAYRYGRPENSLILERVIKRYYKDVQ